jgi:thiol-disulfide isomerase/thioredoxin
LVDVWATWCSPCRAEIPALQKMEKEMEGKDIVFMSYSIDEKKDYDKWKKMIVDSTLGGLQLIGDLAWKSEMATNYKITGIPRFMLFDKEGKIVTIDSPRPSNPELKTMIEKYLK